MAAVISSTRHHNHSSQTKSNHTKYHPTHFNLELIRYVHPPDFTNATQKTNSFSLAPSHSKMNILDRLIRGKKAKNSQQNSAQTQPGSNPSEGLRRSNALRAKNTSAKPANTNTASESALAGDTNARKPSECSFSSEDDDNLKINTDARRAAEQQQADEQKRVLRVRNA